jgi:hypothetical protein
LREHLSLLVGPETEALIFPGVRVELLRRSNFNKMSAWPHAVRTIGAEGLHFRDLRHTGWLGFGTALSFRAVSAGCVMRAVDLAPAPGCPSPAPPGLPGSADPPPRRALQPCQPLARLEAARSLKVFVLAARAVAVVCGRQRVLWLLHLMLHATLTVSGGEGR